MPDKQFKQARTEFEVKEDGDGRTLSGYASTFGGEPDSYGDIIEAGAFKKTIKEQGPPKNRIKLFHLHQFPIGMPKVLSEDKKGLFFEARVSKTALGDEVIELVKDGVLDKMSIGYRTIKERFDEKDDRIRYLDEVKLFEISTVPFPANEGADILGLKRDHGNYDPHVILKSVALALNMKYDTATGLILPASSLEEKAVVTFQDFPLLELSREWDEKSAQENIQTWADADAEPNAEYRSAFVWFDGEAESLFSSYKMPIADVVNGELFAVPEAIFAAASFVQKTEDLEDRDKIKTQLSKYYAKMRKDFDDSTIKAPWEEDEKSFPDVTGIAFTDNMKELQKLKSLLNREPSPDTPTRDKEPTIDGALASIKTLTNTLTNK